MTAKNYDAAFKAMILHEGGYVNHPNDRGGPTNLGITKAVLSAWLGRPASIADVRALKLADVKPIYRANYANAIRFDDLPSGIDYLAFDFAVNSGPSRAAKYLQALVGVEQDGYIGPDTLYAAKAMYERGPAKMITAYADRREAFFRSIIVNNPSQKVFERGWMRRIAEARRVALGMVGIGPSQTPAVALEPPPAATVAKPTPKPATVGFWQAILSFFKRTA